MPTRVFWGGFFDNHSIDKKQACLSIGQLQSFCPGPSRDDEVKDNIVLADDDGGYEQDDDSAESPFETQDENEGTDDDESTGDEGGGAESQIANSGRGSSSDEESTLEMANETDPDAPEDLVSSASRFSKAMLGLLLCDLFGNI